ncbi:hypothetical protein L209DRAFT_743230 [Thermothelomyces heterothallicus CBS 203.75]
MVIYHHSTTFVEEREELAFGVSGLQKYVRGVTGMVDPALTMNAVNRSVQTHSRTAPMRSVALSASAPFGGEHVISSALCNSLLRYVTLTKRQSGMVPGVIPEPSVN